MTTSEQAGRTYAGVEPEQRRADRRRRLMAAMVAVVGESGWEAATVRRIAAEAELGPRSLYESFTDLEDLAAVTYDELGAGLVADALAAIADADDSSDVATVTRAAITAIVERLSEDPRRARFLLCEVPVLAARRTALLHAAAGEYAAQARRAGATLSEQQLRATSLVVAGGGLELIRAWLDGALRLEQAQVSALIAESLTALSARLPAIL
ncbi:TetR family transcriptional regulator [Nocardioides sp. zg-ZUI104]|uniref:TetR/AcrR family transcriptional regulator n=1 Tax=Nocardioides faecalis TaxID=2803858 RepID=UPI001BCE3924|nr:TetR family transcriptional regulator [Nocardioides faecalis]MBS4753814.1 TetR family transcriptional regulator [Nocardioides faecalis]